MMARQRIGYLVCPICGNNEARFVRHLPKNYNLYTCKLCAGKFCDPFFAPAFDFYIEGSDLGSEWRHSGPTRWDADHPTRRSDTFADGKDGLLLDVGCGNGAFGEFAASVGYKVIGLDVDSTSIEIARSRRIPGAKFYCCSLDEFGHLTGMAGHFDVITMFEVFEHLDRPSAVLTRVKRLLREGGLFIGSLPNTARPLMWQLHMDYEMPPYHLTYWTVKSWRHFLERYYDFEILHCFSLHFGYLCEVLKNRMQPPRLIRGILNRVLYPLEGYFERRFDMGGSFYFEARRK